MYSIYSILGNLLVLSFLENIMPTIFLFWFICTELELSFQPFRYKLVNSMNWSGFVLFNKFDLITISY